jgi:Rieske Fe-S protein
VEPVNGDDRPHLPPPSLWPVGFAVGVACILVGLIVDPLVVIPIGVAIVLVFGFLWARDATKGYRAPVPDLEPEVRRPGPPAPPLPAHVGEAAMPEPEPGERFPRSKFLEFSTLGIGGLIGGIVTVPILGPMVANPFRREKHGKLDVGPLSDFPAGQWQIVTFMTDPAEGEVTRRTAYIRNNGVVNGKASFTVLSNRCAHLGCPVQANGPLFTKQKKALHTKTGVVDLTPTLPAGGFGCPCHGGQYDTEGNRTAGPPVRALDRYEFFIRNGNLTLGQPYSVGEVIGSGASAKIKKYRATYPGEHVDGIEQILYPLQPPH